MIIARFAPGTPTRRSRALRHRPRSTSRRRMTTARSTGRRSRPPAPSARPQQRAAGLRHGVEQRDGVSDHLSGLQRAASRGSGSTGPSPRDGAPGDSLDHQQSGYVRSDATSRPDGHAPRHQFALFDGVRSPDGRRAGPTSLGAVEVVETGTSRQPTLRWRFGLASGARGAVRALIADLPHGAASGDRVAFTVRAERPMRLPSTPHRTRSVAAIRLRRHVQPRTDGLVRRPPARGQTAPTSRRSRMCAACCLSWIRRIRNQARRDGWITEPVSNDKP
jgi:hypothetical protein